MNSLFLSFGWLLIWFELIFVFDDVEKELSELGWLAVAVSELLDSLFSSVLFDALNRLVTIQFELGSNETLGLLLFITFLLIWRWTIRLFYIIDINFFNVSI